MRYLLIGLTAVAMAAVTAREITPVVETEALPVDVDDPSIWVNAGNAGQSLVIGTVKRPKPDGGLVVYSLDGKIVERTTDLDRPNNVDILGDLCVTTERLTRSLAVYQVGAAKPHLSLLGKIPVFEGQTGEAGAPMGIALYRRPSDNAVFALVSRKTGPREGYLWEYRIQLEGGGVKGKKVREFGSFSGDGEIEAVAVDQERGLVYYSDENCCVHVWRADPAARDSGQEVARFAQSGFRLNREGIAITGDYVIVTDQLDPRSEYHVYRRKDRVEVAVWRGKAQLTDGIEALARPLGPQFPKGILVTMSNMPHGFQFYRLP